MVLVPEVISMQDGRIIYAGCLHSNDWRHKIYVLKNVYYKISYNNKCFVKYDYGI